MKWCNLTTLPETNSEFIVENGYLEYDRFLLGWPVDGAVVVKPLKTETSGGASSKAPDASHIKHVDKSVRLPNGVKSFQDWGNTLIKMDKYAKNFAELVAFAETDKKAMSYVTWLIWSYASPPILDPANQAEDFGSFARACGLKPANC